MRQEPCPEPLWDPTLDPFAVSRAFQAPSPWTVHALVWLLSAGLGGLALGISWKLPRRSASQPGMPRISVAITLSEPVSSRPEVVNFTPFRPGGATGTPQWAPAPSPGPGGFGDLDALTAVQAFTPSGDLPAAPMNLAPATALGGGTWEGSGGGSPSGTHQGRGGGAFGLRTGDAGSLGPTKGRGLIPIHQVEPHYLLRRGENQDRTPVRVRIRIRLDGVVERAQMVEGSPELRKGAEEAALQWKFAPLVQCGFDQPLVVDLLFSHRNAKPKDAP